MYNLQYGWHRGSLLSSTFLTPFVLLSQIFVVLTNFPTTELLVPQTTPITYEVKLSY